MKIKIELIRDDDDDPDYFGRFHDGLLIDLNKRCAGNCVWSKNGKGESYLVQF